MSESAARTKHLQKMDDWNKKRDHMGDFDSLPNGSGVSIQEKLKQDAKHLGMTVEEYKKSPAGKAFYEAELLMAEMRKDGINVF